MNCKWYIYVLIVRGSLRLLSISKGSFVLKRLGKAALCIWRILQYVGESGGCGGTVYPVGGAAIYEHVHLFYKQAEDARFHKRPPSWTIEAASNIWQYQHANSIKVNLCPKLAVRQ